MRRDDREGIICVHLNVRFSKTATDPKSPATEQESVVRMRAAGGNRKPAQKGDVDVRVVSGDVFPKRKIQSAGLERATQFLERLDAPHLLQSQHVRLERKNALPNLGLRLGRFDIAAWGRFIQVAFDIVSGH